MTRKYSKELNLKGEEVWFMLNKIFKLFFQVNNKYDSSFWRINWKKSYKYHIISIFNIFQKFYKYL